MGFRIQRSTDGVTFHTITNVNANVTTYTDHGLMPETTYFYRIGAFNACGFNNKQSVASATTLPSTCPTPAPPSNLTATATSSSSIDLSWTDNSNNEMGFRIQRSTNGVTFAPLVNVNANVTTYTDNGLNPGTTYFYRVGAFNACGFSNDPTAASATTFGGGSDFSVPAHLR
jgi:phosphodiesterase/alkaline phosphatase D-like protein